MFIYLAYKGLSNYFRNRHDSVFLVGFISYLVLGVGSFCFHATLTCMYTTPEGVMLKARSASDMLSRPNATAGRTCHDLHVKYIVLRRFLPRSVYTHGLGHRTFCCIPSGLHHCLLPLPEEPGLPSECLCSAYRSRLFPEHVRHGEGTSALTTTATRFEIDGQEIQARSKRTKSAGRGDPHHDVEARWMRSGCCWTWVLAVES